MIAKKKKLSRKEIKEDKLVSTYYKAFAFFEEHKQKVTTYGLIAVIAVIAVYFYLSGKKQENEEAGVKLSRIMNVFDSGSYLEAIEGREGTNIVGLKKIVEDYGGTENGETAKIFLADAYSMLDNPEEAYKWYSDYGGSIDVFEAASLAGQAAYYESKGDYESAADLYLRASRVSETNVMNPDYLLQAGINYLKFDKKEEAKDAFDTIAEKYKTSSAAKEVNKYIVLTQ